jgi:beta-aspartyl-peptidase (threonine type)
MSSRQAFALALHGGAGTFDRERLTAEREHACREALAEALRSGHAVLDAGGGAVDAVAAAVACMEDSPLFNAGRGSVFTHDGRHEMDAAVMSGSDHAAGAVLGVSRVRNPVRLAVEVMRASEHVMLAGAGAEQFAAERDVLLVDPAWFSTARRRRQLARVQGIAADELRLSEDETDDHKFGTVGAVALDRSGDLAAATSTGGMTNKRYGRIGDSPVIGAGTYADNAAGAVSATGHGEYFLRCVVAHDICARVRYADIDLQHAADAVIRQRLASIGGEGGVVAMDPGGHVVYSFNTNGMYRGHIDAQGRCVTAVFAGESES